MNTNKTAQLSSALLGLIPASSGLQAVDSSKVIMLQPQANGVDAVREIARSILGHMTTKYNKETDRLYMYPSAGCDSTKYDKLKQAISKDVRLIGPYSLVVDNVSRVNRAVVTANETFESFVARIKKVVSGSGSDTVDQCVKVDHKAKRIYAYFKTVRMSGAKLHAIKQVMGYHGAFTVITSGEYALTLRFDYDSQPQAQSTPVEVDVATPNRLLSGLSDTSGLFDHIEELRGKVSDSVLEQMKEALRASLPKVKWTTAGVPVTITNKLGVPVDLTLYYDLLNKPGAELLPQHVGAGLKVEIGTGHTVAAASVTLFKRYGIEKSMFAVIRDAKGYHNHIIFTLK